ncbi:MAG: L,D-transpeptidase [Acetobacter persici]|uniref:L,D-transpeptidase n=1 Tax=Acetobacter persici TaxID=1076596 RepID=UPI0039E9C52F
MSGAKGPTLLFIAGSLLLVPGLACATGAAQAVSAPPVGQAGGQPAQADQEGAPSPPLTPAEPVLKEAPPLPEIPVLNEEDARAEATRLNSAFRHEVPVALKVSSAQKAAWIALAKEQIQQASFPLDRPQVVLVVDRNPAVQRMCLMLALPGQSDWQVIGSTKVSTGTTGRKFYYITPNGVFINTADIIGYRALGTKNEHCIIGNRTKGMRVWDFGWQWAEKGWLPVPREKGQIRLEMHATDPVYLESRLGHVASEGCIRIPSSLNVFIDKHGLIDVEDEQMAVIDNRFRALLRPDRVATPLAGSAVIVVDSASRPDLAQVTISENKAPARHPAQQTHS